MRPAIFFDCDGVLNEEPGGHGVLGPDDIRLIPGAGAAVRAARRPGTSRSSSPTAPRWRRASSPSPAWRRFSRGFALAGRGRRYRRCHLFLPASPERGTPGGAPEFQIACECRKPGTLLFRRAIADFGIDVGRSALIGDSLRDIGAGRAMGLTSYGVRTGYACRDVERYPDRAPPVPDRMFADVGEAVAFCLAHPGKYGQAGRPD